MTRKEEIRAANDFANSVTVAANRAEKAAEKQAKKSEDFANAAAANAEQLRRASLSAKQAAEEQAAAAKKAREASNTEILENARSSGQISKGQAKFGQMLSKAGIPLGRSSKDLAANASTLSAGLNLASAGFGGLTKSMQILGKGFRSNTLDAGGVAEGVGSFVSSITGVTKYMG